MNLYLRMLQWVRPYAGRVLIAFGAMLIFALTGAAPFTLIQPILDEIFVSSDTSSLIRLPFILVSLFLIKGVANFCASFLMRQVGQNVVSDLRRRLFAKMLSLPLARFHTTSTGDLLSRVLFDTTQVETALSRQIAEILKESLMLLFLFGALFWFSWRYALIALVTVPCVMLPMAALRHRIRRASHSGQEQMGDLSGVLQEALSSILVVKSFQMEPFENRRFEDSNRAYLRASLEAARYEILSTPIIEVIAAIVIAITLYLGGMEVINGRTTTGTFFAFMGTLFAMYKPVSSLSKASSQLQQALAAALRIFEILDAPAEPVGGTRQVPDGPLQVRYRSVGFRYAERPVLENVNLDLNPGEVVALVGLSGAGKTSLAHLLPRLYDPTEGQIEIEGAALPEYSLESLRARVGLVSQDAILFRDTVRANLCHGRTDLDDTALWRALEDAAAADFVRQMPGGLDAFLSDRGSNLSGGQRQRLALARALLKDPPILVLDEATSALDAESEKLVQTALNRLLSGRTVLVIAHRLSTILAADRIVVLEKGHIVETGKHAELLAGGGPYARLYAEGPNLFH